MAFQKRTKIIVHGQTPIFMVKTLIFVVKTVIFVVIFVVILYVQTYNFS